MLTNRRNKYLLLWSTILWYCTFPVIKAQVINPYLVSIANVTLESSNSAQVVLRIINTNTSFQSSPISLLISLTDSDLSNSQLFFNITSLPTQVQALEKTLPNLIQDKEYTLTMTILQTNRELSPLQPVNRSINIITTNVQSVSISDQPNNCKLTLTCQFAIGSTANACMITYEGLDVNNTINSTTNQLLQIERESNTQLSASGTVSGEPYQSLLRNEMYTIEAYGLINGERIDSVEASTVIELTGTVELSACQDTTGTNLRSQLGVIAPLGLLVIIIIVVVMITLVAVVCKIVRKRRRKERLRLEEEALKNHHCSLCPHHHHESHHHLTGEGEGEGEGGEGGVEESEKYIDVDNRSPCASPNSSPSPPLARREGEGESEEEGDLSPKPEYIEVLPDSIAAYSSPYPSSISPSSPQDDEEDCTYENIGASNSRRLAPKTTPTGLVVPKKVLQNGGVAHTPPKPPPPHILKQTSLNSDKRILNRDHRQRQSMPSTAFSVEEREEEGEGEDDENEYVDVTPPPLPAVALKRNKAYRSMETLPS